MVRIIFTITFVASMLIGVTASADQSRTARSTVQTNRKGPVAKLIELERRKNEWLREKMGR